MMTKDQGIATIYKEIERRLESFIDIVNSCDNEKQLSGIESFIEQQKRIVKFKADQYIPKGTYASIAYKYAVQNLIRRFGDRMYVVLEEKTEEIKS